ncbi:DUF2333 family protein [Salinicola endophyticus]|uniref:DUF2333 family protein n=1 Tax=Salinicola endophyticus TaxID=1949083 RepID=UPI000DA24E36|nr:DUF2333 family protein [Salinicola endophyticus]
MALFRKKAPLSRTEVLETPQYGWIWKPLVALVAIYLLICIVLGIWWSWTPSPVDPRQAVAMQRGAPQSGGESQAPAAIKPGEALLATNIELLDTLLDKPGGYLRNDVMPPGLWLDNMPSWEAGVTQQVQDSVASLGSALEVGQAPLKTADEALAGDLDSWRWPESETLLRAARNNLGEAFSALENTGAGTPGQEAAAPAPSAPGADALSAWLAQVQSRLETQTQALAAAVGRSPGGGQAVESTPWFRIDNVFFKTRGTTWALLQLMQAARIDYAEVIEKAGQGEAFDQLIAELKASQAQVWSPVILNGSGFGFFANHSLMMANYTVRATQLIGKIRSAL